MTNFYLSTNKKSNKLNNSLCGTAEYLSPEMINGTGHDHTTDWWGFGIMVYEMLIGIPPFYNKNKNEMFQNIKKKAVVFPNA